MLNYKWTSDISETNNIDAEGSVCTGSKTEDIEYERGGTKKDSSGALEMPEGANTAKEVGRKVSLENQKGPLKCVPFILKPFPVGKISYKVHKIALWQPSKIFSGVDSCCKLLVSKEGGQQVE